MYVGTGCIHGQIQQYYMMESDALYIHIHIHSCIDTYSKSLLSSKLFAVLHDSLPAFENLKTFICISTVLTWARSKPVDPVGASTLVTAACTTVVDCCLHILLC